MSEIITSPERENPRTAEERAEAIIDAVIAAAKELNPQIERKLEQTGGSLFDKAHQENPLDEAHLLSLELKHPEADPLISMIEETNDEHLRTLVLKLIDKGDLTLDEREIIQRALIAYLR